MVDGKPRLFEEKSGRTLGYDLLGAQFWDHPFTSGIMLPVGGLLIAIFTGWILPKRLIQDELNWSPRSGWFLVWCWIQRYFAPVAIILILLTSFRII